MVGYFLLPIIAITVPLMAVAAYFLGRFDYRKRRTPD